jgi:hypothetical protein
MKGVLGKRDREVRKGEGWLGWRRPLGRLRLGLLSSKRGLRLGRGRWWRRGRDLAGWRLSWWRYEAASRALRKYTNTLISITPSSKPPNPQITLSSKHLALSHNRKRSAQRMARHLIQVSEELLRTLRTTHARRSNARNSCKLAFASLFSMVTFLLSC